ncbi:unnamed protein product, partial [Mesorhabditis spiculigera]
MNSVPPPVELTMANTAARANITSNWLLATDRGILFGYLEKDDDSEYSEYYDQKRAERYLDDDSEKKVQKHNESEDEDDLDAFMAGINAQAASDQKESQKKEAARAAGKEEVFRSYWHSYLFPVVQKAEPLGLDEEDMQESMMKYLADYKEKEAAQDEIHEYDEDGKIIFTFKKHIDPLPKMDHASVAYKPFKKDFYKEHEEISKMNVFDAGRLRDKLDLKVAGNNPPKPVCSFAHFGFDQKLMAFIRKSEYEQPTPIQAQAVPAALAGRDVLGIAKTGSGKTAAYLWPAIEHIKHQPPLKEGDGPIALVVVPTRELAIQVYQEAKRFCKAHDINVICAYGGGSKWEQQNELQSQGAELVVCTPGRIIDLVKIKATNLQRVTFLVFDEADRMFDLGFEAQVASISQHVRPDRQTLMFSATFKPKVEHLARDALADPVRIVQGNIGEANEDVEQTIHVMKSPEVKMKWLCDHLVQFSSEGKVLVFVTKKTDAEDLAARLRTRDFELELLHGDMFQHERNERLALFRKKCKILVATDVAARGLDIPEIRTVINYDAARDIDTHVHRIGRTGRAGQKGRAFTLILEADSEFSAQLVQSMESAGRQAPPALVEVASKCLWFKNQRVNKGQTGRIGLGFASSTTSGSSGANPLKSYIPSQKAEYIRPSTADPPSSSSGSSSGSSGGASSTKEPVASTRLSMLRNAYQSAYTQKFQRSQLPEPEKVVTDPRPEWKKRLDDFKAKVERQAPHSSSNSHSNRH